MHRKQTNKNPNKKNNPHQKTKTNSDISFMQVKTYSTGIKIIEIRIINTSGVKAPGVRSDH